jgi:hypothetical protein
VGDGGDIFGLSGNWLSTSFSRLMPLKYPIAARASAPTTTVPVMPVAILCFAAIRR